MSCEDLPLGDILDCTQINNIGTIGRSMLDQALQSHDFGSICCHSLEEDLENSLLSASNQQNRLNPAFRQGDIQVAVFEEIIKGMQVKLFPSPSTLRGSSVGSTLGFLPNGHQFESLQGHWRFTRSLTSGSFEISRGARRRLQVGGREAQIPRSFGMSMLNVDQSHTLEDGTGWYIPHNELALNLPYPVRISCHPPSWTHSIMDMLPVSF
uniref:Uncharacterized protein n=1 Tax=Vitis vinifera TaxID=29760 RepID=A5AJP5_VITVI|nr:hypothetical protein VITISV_010756 [Vitis vinifera]